MLSFLSVVEQYTYALYNGTYYRLLNSPDLVTFSEAEKACQQQASSELGSADVSLATFDSASDFANLLYNLDPAVSGKDLLAPGP